MGPLGLSLQYLPEIDHGKGAFDFRVFDEAQVAAREVTVKDYTSLDEYPDLILYEGWFDKEANKVEIEKQAS